MIRQELYNSVGKANIQIVKLENIVRDLEEVLRRPDNEPDHEAGVRESLSDARTSLRRYTAEVAYCRAAIIESMQEEIKMIDIEVDNSPLKEKITLLSLRSDLTKEVEMLKRLIAC